VFTEIYALFNRPGPLKGAETLVYYIMRQGSFGTNHLGRAASTAPFKVVFFHHPIYSST